MNAVRSELAYDFPTAQGELEYNAWLQKKVEKSISDDRPTITLDEMDMRVAARIQALRGRNQVR